MLDGEEDGQQPDNAAQDAAQQAASAAARDGDGGVDQQDGGEGQNAGHAAGADQGQQQPGDGKGQNAIADAAAEARAKDSARPYQQRIDEITRARREAERRAEAAEAKLAELARKGGGEQPGADGQQPITLDPAVIDELANERAQKIAAQQFAEQNFNNACNAAFEKGIAAHGDAFKSALETCGSMGILDPRIVADALETDAPHDVLYQLGQNPERALQIAKMPQAKRIAEFVKMTVKPAAPAKAAVSKAPAPVQGINGGAGSKDFNFLDPNADDAEWHRRMDEAERARRAASR